MMGKKGWSGSPKHTESHHSGSGMPAARSTVNGPGMGKTGDKVAVNYDRDAMKPSGGGKMGRGSRG